MINEKFDTTYKVVTLLQDQMKLKKQQMLMHLAVLDNGKALDISQLSSLIKG